MRNINYCYDKEKTLRELGLVKNPCFLGTKHEKARFYCFVRVTSILTMIYIAKQMKRPNPCITLSTSTFVSRAFPFF